LVPELKSARRLASSRRRPVSGPTNSPDIASVRTNSPDVAPYLTPDPRSHLPTIRAHSRRFCGFPTSPPSSPRPSSRRQGALTGSSRRFSLRPPRASPSAEGASERRESGASSERRRKVPPSIASPSAEGASERRCVILSSVGGRSSRVRGGTVPPSVASPGWSPRASGRDRRTAPPSVASPRRAAGLRARPGEYAPPRVARPWRAAGLRARPSGHAPPRVARLGSSAASSVAHPSVARPSRRSQVVLSPFIVQGVFTGRAVLSPWWCPAPQSSCIIWDGPARPLKFLQLLIPISRFNVRSLNFF